MSKKFDEAAWNKEVITRFEMMFDQCGQTPKEIARTVANFYGKSPNTLESYFYEGRQRMPAHAIGLFCEYLDVNPSYVMQATDDLEKVIVSGGRFDMMRRLHKRNAS